MTFLSFLTRPVTLIGLALLVCSIAFGFGYYKGRINCVALSKVKALKEEITFLKEEQQRKKDLQKSLQLQQKQALKQKQSFENQIDHLINTIENDAQTKSCEIGPDFFNALGYSRLFQPKGRP